MSSLKLEQRTDMIEIRDVEKVGAAKHRLFSSLNHRVGAELLAAAGFALEARPHGVELVHSSLHQGRVFGQDTRLKVAGAAAIHPQTGAGQVGAAYVGQFEVEDDNLEMHPGA